LKILVLIQLLMSSKIWKNERQSFIYEWFFFCRYKYTKLFIHFYYISDNN